MNPRIPAVLVLSLLLAACSNWNDPKTERAERAAKASGDIVIGVVWPWGGAKGSLSEGIDLAVDEINANGGVLNRKLRIIKEDDESSLLKGRLIAQNFAENYDMVGVIGHLNSYIAIPASTIYQSSGLVYLTPGATNYQLNDQGYSLVFRSIPSNRALGKHLANYMAAQGYRRVAIYYIKDKSSQSMVNYFEQRASELGLQIVDRRSYLKGARDFSNVLHDWKDLYHFDAMLLAGNMPGGADIITQARAIGLKVPIVGGAGLDTVDLMKLAGTAAEGVAIPAFLIHDKDSPRYQHFDELYSAKYHRQFGTFAAQGYDAVYLFKQAIQQANSSIPDKISQALHHTKNWMGVSGEYTFDNKGDIPDKKIGMKTVHGGAFIQNQLVSTKSTLGYNGGGE